MLILERAYALRSLSAAIVAALTLLVVVAPAAQPARAEIGIPSPCSIPGGDLICDVIKETVKAAAQATADFIMRGVTSWVTNAAVWVTGKVGELIAATASPDVAAGWFQSQYRSMLTVAGALAFPLLLLALIQAVLRQDVWILLRSALGYLPMAFILAAGAIVGTQLIVSITDDLSRLVVEGLGGSSSSNLLQSVGDAYKQALDDTSGAVPLFGIFLGAIILAIGAFVLWLEMVIRDAAIYIALFFLPLTFVAMIWPATSRWAKRLVEVLIAIVLAKFVIISILSLATAAITNTTLADSGGDVFERMIAGAALLVLAAWSPFALLRLIPMMEIAAASVTSQRASMSNAAGSAGIQSPAAYMRQAMDRHSRASTSPSSTGTPRTAYVGGTSSHGTSYTERTTERSRSSERAASARQPADGDARTDAASSGPGRATYAPPPGPTGGESGVETTSATESRRQQATTDEETARSGSTGSSQTRPRPSDPPPESAAASDSPPPQGTGFRTRVSDSPGNSPPQPPPDPPRRVGPPPDPRPPRPPHGDE